MKTVICGVWHVHAEGYCKEASQFTEIIGVYDPDKARLTNFCNKLGLKAFESFDELLKSGADSAIVCASTDTHAEYIIELAKAKINVFTEKVLAKTSEECRAIAKSIEENGVNFVISFPHKCYGGPKTIKNIVDSGELGKINYFRFRNVHSGSISDWLPVHFYSEKECGGGAMIDLGAHGMYLAEWICGMPESAKSIFTLSCERESTALKNKDGVEDNAITIMEYKNGCIAVNETGFVSNGYPAILEVGGEKGSARLIGAEVTKCTEATDYKEVKVELSGGAESPLKQFLKEIYSDEFGIEKAINLTKLMEMAYSRK